MVRGFEQGTTGFGISSIVGDGDNRIVEVGTDRQTITFFSYGKTKQFSFEEFAKLEEIDW